MKIIKIGRSSENDIVIDDDTNISRHHAELFIDDEKRVFLTDLNSANGTYVNGKKLIGSDLLKENDIVKIGKTVLPWKNYLDLKNKPKIQQEISKNKIEDQKTDYVATNKEDEDEEEKETNSSNFFGYIITIGAAFIYTLKVGKNFDPLTIIACMIGALIIPLIFAALLSLIWVSKYGKVFPWVLAVTSIILFILAGIGNSMYDANI